MMSGEVFQAIYNELSRYILPDCEKLIVYLEYGESSYSFAFYEKTINGYVKCFDLPNSSEGDLASTFKTIDTIISKERKAEKGELWTNMTIIVSINGDVKAEFDYTNLSDGTYEYMKEWRKKYLI